MNKLGQLRLEEEHIDCLAIEIKNQLGARTLNQFGGQFNNGILPPITGIIFWRILRCHIKKLG